MNNRANIPLIVVFFAGLLGLHWADVAGLPTEKERRRAEGRVLPALVSVRPDDVHRVEITGGPDRLLFERRGPHRWQMLTPIDTAADPSMVESLAFNLKSLAKAPDVGTLADDPAKVGLDRPIRTVRLYGADDPERPIAALDVGSIAHEKRFVRPEGTVGIEVVDARALAAIELPPVRWRDRSLLRFSTFQAESLAAVGPGRDLRLVRDGDLWLVRSPYRAVADVQRVEGILAELTSLRVVEGDAGFAADDVKDLGRFGLDRPSVSITVKPRAGDGDAQTLHLGKPSPGSTGRYYARRGDQDEVVLVDVPLLKDLGESPAALHGKKVADIRPNRVDFLRLTSGGATVTAARTDKGWTRLSPLVDPADVAAINDLIHRLDGLEASVLLDEKSAPDPRFGTPTAVLEVWQGAGHLNAGVPASAPTLKLTIGRVDPLNRTAFARTEGDPIVLGLPSTFLDGLTLGPLAFRDRQVASAMPGDLDRVAIQAGTKSVTIVHPAPAGAADGLAARGPRLGPGRSGGGWSAPQAPERPPCRHARHEHAGTGRDLWLRQTLDHRHLDGEGRCSLAGRRGGGNDPDRRQGGAGRPGEPRVSSSPIVFTLDPETLTLFEAEWRDRLILSFPVRKIDRITLRWPTVSISARPIADVRTKDPEWTLVDPPAGIDFDAARLKPLAAALANLVTFRYSQYEGPIAPETGLFPGRFSVQVHLDDGSTHTLRLGNRTGDGYLMATVETGPSGLIFQLPLSGWEPWIRPPGPSSPPGPRP